MTKRPTRAKRVAAWLQASGAESSVHELARGLAELIGSLAGSELELEDAIRGACRMRDLYRAERSRADEAERLAIAADDFWSEARLDCECTSRLWDMPADVLAGIAAIRARQEQRGKESGNG